MRLFGGFLALLATGVGATDVAVDKCTLLGGAEPAKPFPSLTQCYKQNQQACCVSAHDAQIQGEYSELLSDTCVREYQDLEHYYCLGCNPRQSEFIDLYCTGTDTPTGCVQPPAVTHANSYQNSTTIGVINVCSAFKNSLLYIPDDDGQAQTNFINVYDNCGMTLPGDASVASCEIVYNESDRTGQTPSSYFKKNAKAELAWCYAPPTGCDAARFREVHNCGASPQETDQDNDSMIAARAAQIFFQLIRPTYFDTDLYDIDTTKATDCFSAAPALAGSLSLTVLMVAAVQWIVASQE
jgi:hypothetical protein